MKKKEKSARSIPFNCVDKCLLALDRVNEPMLTYGILNLEGPIDQARLNQAILSAQRTHPVMRTIVHSKNLKLSREIQDDLGTGVLSIADQAQLGNSDHDAHLASWMNRPLDLSREFPVRGLLLKRNEQESSLVMAFHHSAADGLRALVFVREIIDSYNGDFPKRAGSERDIRVSRRGDELLEFAHSQRSKVKRYYRRMIYSLFHRFVVAAFHPPTRVFHDGSGHSRELGFCVRVVPPSEFEQVRSRARWAGARVNDILLAACHQTVEKWNGMHGKASRRIRIMVPVNVSPDGFHDVVSNQVSWCSLATTRADRTDAVGLLRKVKTDTASAIADGMAFSLIYFFYFCSRFPLWVMKGMCRFLMVSRIYVDTILITNLGLIWAQSGSEEPAVRNVGDARITNVIGSAPVVTPMGLSIAVGIYGKNLNLSLTYRPALLSEEKARMFLDLYAEEIKNYQVGAQTV